MRATSGELKLSVAIQNFKLSRNFQFFINGRVSFLVTVSDGCRSDFHSTFPKEVVRLPNRSKKHVCGSKFHGFRSHNVHPSVKYC